MATAARPAPPASARPASPKLKRAVELLNQGKPEAARLLLRGLMATHAGDPVVSRLMCSALLALGQPTQALYHAENAIKASPDSPDLLNLKANAEHHAGRHAEAEATLRRALEIEPRHAPNLTALARTLSALGRYAEVVEVAGTALRVAPGSEGALAMIVPALEFCGRADEAVALLQERCATDPGNPFVLSLMCATMNHAPGVRPADLAAAHRAFGRMMIAQMPRRLEIPADRFDPDRPLRVGFISAELRRHAMTHFFEPFAERFDRGSMSLHLYHHAGAEDEVSARYRALPGVRWRNTTALTPMALATQIGEDRIDVLIDAVGHVATPAVMALHLKPAPVIASWLSYPCTTGLDAVDYRIVDAHTDPDGFERLSSEKLWRLEPYAQCYRPPADSPEVGPCPSESAAGGAVTFGCFSAAHKLNDAVLRRWVMAMRLTPGSRLLLKNHILRAESEREHLARRLEGAGLPRSRFELHGPTPSAREHLDLYNRVDVALDTHPYPAITTALESVHMGVPLVNMTHGTSAGRAAVPILRAAGLDDLVTDSDEAYARAAATIAADAPRRAALRRDLRARLAASPLRDEQGWTDRFSAALREMWRKRCAVK